MNARQRALADVRRIALALPEATERESHGAPSWFVRQRPQFATFCTGEYATKGGEFGIWCAAPEGVQAEIVAAEPERFFVPPYVGGRGWLGLRLDISPDSDELASVLADAFRTVAPKFLSQQIDGGA